MPRKGNRRKNHRTISSAATAAVAKVSLLPQYGVRKSRKSPQVIPIVIDDPYAFSDPAFLREPPAKSQTCSMDDAEWIAPAKKPIEVLASARDVVAGMFARGQIDKAMLMAARKFEEIFATAMALPVPAMDPSKPLVSGGDGEMAGRIDAVCLASAALKRAESRLQRRYGAVAVKLVRLVLIQGWTVQRVAAGHGDRAERAVAWWGGTLRRCLQELAEVEGFAVNGAYRNREREDERREKQRKRAEHNARERKKRGKRRKDVQHGLA